MTIIVKFLLVFYCFLLNGIRNDKINVVVFLAEIQNCNFNDDGLRFLKFVRETDVKACYESECNKLLKSSLDSLINYAKSGLGMTTVTITNKKKLGRQSEIITSSQHREEFHPRIMRRSMSNKPKSSILNHLKMMSAIQMTFIGELFDDKEVSLVEENFELPEKSRGKCKNYSFLEVIRTTMDNIDESNGFLMVIFGEFLNEISDIYSPLLQSIKYITETTDCKKTLIIITGKCPRNNHVLIPVYARGPRRDELRDLKKLYNLPYIIKGLLSETSEESNLIRHKRNVKNSKASRIFPSVLFLSFILYNLIS